MRRAATALVRLVPQMNLANSNLLLLNWYACVPFGSMLILVRMYTGYRSRNGSFRKNLMLAELLEWESFLYMFLNYKQNHMVD